MKQFISGLLLVLGPTVVLAQKLDKEYQKVVAAFINHVKHGEKRKLAAMVSYPLNRDYPIPAIQNKEEFQSRYSEVFDDELIKMISKSSLVKDWSAVGWRGIMLLNGEVWLDYDGKLIAVNYQSKKEREMKARLVELDKQKLYPALRNFVNPTLIIETNRFRVRIDETSNGKYRYASWPLKSSMAEKPDLVIENGEVSFDGTGGNHEYDFKNGDFTYEVNINVMREDSTPPASLSIDKGEKQVLFEAANVIGE